MMITPQARRRIDSAVHALSGAQRARWGDWAGKVAPNQIPTVVPYDIAEIALEALATAEREIETRLRGGVDEDSEADLLNDLGYIQAIETTLRREGVGQ